MQHTKVDYILVGQGLAGSWLAHELIKRELSVVVLNHETDKTSTLRAAGLYNPITGRKMVKTWFADKLFANLEEAYQNIENLLNKKFLYPLPLYRPFQTIEDKNNRKGCTGGSYGSFVDCILPGGINQAHLSDGFGGIVVKHTGYVDLLTFVSSFRSYLLNKGIYRSGVFDYKELELEDTGIFYKEFCAKKIIFCQGTNYENKLWKELPFRLVRGELMDVTCGIETEYIIIKSVFMIPKNGFFTVGATYDHENLSFDPQKKGIESLKLKFSKLYRGSYRISDKRAGVRPATFDGKPFIGLHPKYNAAGIFNGFGTKGVSLAPYFAARYADFLEGKTSLEPKVDVQRVY